MRFLTAIAFLLLLPSQALAAVHVMTNGRITIDFADPGYGSSGDSDRVDFLLWIKSDETSDGNLVANSTANLVCGEPTEFFGEAYTDYSTPGGPFMVVAGVQSSWTGNLMNGRTVTNIKATTCLNSSIPRLDGVTETQYTLSRNPSLINSLHITRTFRFRPGTASNNLRVYTPRIHYATYNTVIIPDTNGVPQTYSSLTCYLGCAISNWNGVWFADDDGNGNGLAVIRDSASTAPALIEVDSDGCSQSNLTSIALKVPTGGWTGKVADSEYLCFYNSTSWPAANRSAGILPTGCQVR